jgi:hypothetical protein
LTKRGKLVSIAWDRVDTFANTLISFIALNVEHFHESALFIVKQQNPTLHEPLYECLNLLSTMRGVNISNIAKHNRINFVQNFRDFSVRIKSLSFK